MTKLASDCPFGYGAAELRREAPGRTIGDLVQPGALIQAGPADCPYLVDRVMPAVAFGVPCWRLSGYYAPGGIAERSEARRWWLNEWVAVDYAPAALGFIIRPLGVYRYECPLRDALFLVVGQGAAQNRAGQLGLML